MRSQLRRNKESGQVAVEYILLLAVGVTIWLLLMTELVSRNPDSPGIIVKKWRDLIELVAKDRIE